MAADGTLVIQTKIDTKGISKGLEEIRNKINSVEIAKISDLSTTFETLSKTISSMPTKPLTSVSRDISKIANIETEKISKTTNYFSELSAILSETPLVSATEFTKSLRLLISATEKLNKETQNVGAVNNLTKAIQGISKAVNSISPQSVETLSLLTDMLKSFAIIGQSSAGISQITPALDSVVTAMQLLQYVKTKKISKNFTQAAKSIQQLYLAISQISPAKIISVNSVLQSLSTGAQGIATLTAVNISKLPSISAAINDFVKALIVLPTNASSKLSMLAQSVATLGVGISKIKNATAENVSAVLKSIFNTLSEIPAIDVSTLERVSNSMYRLSYAAQQLYKIYTQMQKASNNAAEGIKKVGTESEGAATDVNALKQQLRENEKLQQRGEKAAKELGDKFQQLASKTGFLSKMFSSLKTGISKITSSMNTMRSTTDSAIKRLISYVGIWGAVSFAKNTVEDASALKEYQNVAEQVFGSQLSLLQEFNSTAIETFGLSELTATRVSSSFAAMGKAMGQTSAQSAEMSLQLTALVGDFASFYNVSHERAQQALSAVYTGETETLKQYGIIITDVNLQQYENTKGLGRNVRTMTAAEKTLLRYNYIMEATSAAQGDFARTADVWANQIRVLSERFRQFRIELGELLIKGLTPLVKYLNVVISRMTYATQVLKATLTNIFGIEWDTSATTAATEETTAAMSELSKATDEAADSAKNMLGTYDTLNVIQQNTADITSTTTDITPKLIYDTSAVNKVEKEISSDINSLFELGRRISVGIKNYLNKINWQKLTKQAQKFSEGFADLLNGLIDKDAFSTVGNTLAQSLNLTFKTLGKFVSTFRWKELATAIAAGIKTALSNIQWNDIKSVVGNLAQSLAETINTLASDTEVYSGIGKFFAELLNTIFTYFEKFWQTVDIDKVGTAILEVINSFFENADFNRIGKTVGTFLYKLLKLILKLLKGTDWKLVGQRLGELIANINISEIIATLAKIFIQIISGAFEAAFAMFKEAPAEMGTLFTVLFAGLAIKVAAATIKVLKLVKAFKELAAGIKAAQTASTILTQLQTATGNASVATQTLANTTKTAIPAASASVGMFAKKFAGISLVVTGATSTISGMVSVAKNGFSTLNVLITTIGIAIGSLGLLLLGIPGKIVAIVAAALAAIFGLIGLIKSALKSFDKSVVQKTTTKQSLNMSKVNTRNVPQLANGAVIPPNKAFLAVLGDQKSGTNIEAPLSTITEAMKLALSGMSLGGDIVVNIDGREVFRAVRTENQKYKQQTGKSGLI